MGYIGNIWYGEPLVILVVRLILTRGPVTINRPHSHLFEVEVYG